MAETALSITSPVPMTLASAGVEGLNLFADPQAIDKANGNYMPYKSGRCLAVRNTHATENITLLPKVQRTVKEGAEDLPVDALTPVTVLAGEAFIFGPWSTNFKKAAAGIVPASLNFAWAGSNDGTDIEVAILDLA